MESTLKEGGDIMIPVEEGVICESDIKGEIGKLLTGDVAGRERDEQITLYKSHGIFTQDLYAADYVLAKANDANAGTFIDDF